jgi:hypothetical protein
VHIIDNPIFAREVLPKKIKPSKWLRLTANPLFWAGKLKGLKELKE